MRTRRFQLRSDGSFAEQLAAPPANIRPLPRDVPDLVRELDKLIPPRCIGPAESPEDAHRYAGQRELVEHLLARLAVTTDPTRPVLRPA